MSCHSDANVFDVINYFTSGSNNDLGYFSTPWCLIVEYTDFQLADS